MTTQTNDSLNSTSYPRAPDETERTARMESLKHLGAFAEGDFFPLRQKTIKALLGGTQDYIVFVDETDQVEWTKGEMEFHEKHGEVTARVIDLQSL